MRRLRRVLVASLVAGGAVVFLEALARALAGVPLPTELFSDWFLPMLPVDTFLSFLGRLGGPITAKELAFWGGFVAIAAAVLVAAVVWQWLQRRWWGGRAAFLVIAALVVTAILVLFPVLAASYVGLPPTWAALVSAAGLVGAVAIAAIAIRMLGSAPDRFNSGRRELLSAGAGLLLFAAAGGLGLGLFRDGTFAYDGTRLRGPVRRAVTPVGDFYIVTKNLIDPNVDKGLWRLEVGGLVAEPFSLSLDQLRAFPAQTQETTLECISNGVGYGLLSNGIWTGPSLKVLLARARPASAAQFVEMQSADGYIYTLPLDRALRGDVMVAHAMNGAPLTRRHGAPARAIVPGVYGEGSPKWLTRISLRDHDVPGYYARQGWRADFVHTTAVIDRPTRTQVVRMGEPVAIAGVAFAGDRGVSRVEISTDDGQTWSAARITYAPSPLAWALWSADWTPSATGSVVLSARAYDGSGAPQEVAPHGFAPAGATGRFRVEVQVA